ncbi:MAG: multiheme c-type cytochrome [bacterium]
MIRVTCLLVLCLFAATTSAQTPPTGDDALGTRSYDDYEKPAVCKSCHVDFYQQWKQSMMSQAYTHHWDEIEYFELAVPHAEKDEKVAGVKAGCNGCHAPISFLAGDVPPPRPEENSRANESVSCDLCHSITGFEGDTPHNFNWISEPGRTKYGPKPGLESPHHETEQNDFLKTGDYCGTCHNEMSPYGIWVKSTHLEWREGPYAAENVHCQACHMPPAHGISAKMAQPAMVAQHLFHGAHDPGKLAGAIEMRMHPQERELEFDEVVTLKLQLFNGKCGHKVPSGSVEDRIVWLHVTATDSEDKTYHLPVDAKGFDGEEYTIAAETLAYQDMGIALDRPDFAGVQRDGVPVGDRIFRMPYFDPQGRMTIQQWNTAALGVDYRIGPRETKIETFTWELPADLALGEVRFEAVLFYQRLVTPVAEFLNVPADETEAVVINRATTWVEVYD